MATRKEKHARALEKREKFLEDERNRCETVLKASNEIRERKNRESWQDKHDEKHSWKKIDEDCPHCKDRLRAQKSETAKREAEKQKVQSYV